MNFLYELSCKTVNFFLSYSYVSALKSVLIVWIEKERTVVGDVLSLFSFSGTDKNIRNNEKKVNP
jgi:hypothetical protein